MIKKIMVALDGSAQSEKALQVAVQETKLRGGELHAVYVVQHIITHQMMFDSGTKTPQIAGFDLANEILVKEAERVLTSAEETARDSEVNFIAHRLFGDPRDEIISFAEEKGIDLIILGTKGKSNLERMVLGSVSSAVVKNSGKTTLLVR
ncbi:universal stress protein [Methanoplanus sp. FWC-SCC4]|uniref:Universal stress protein n=1 Tax=Methanochimaera problematica TaxID=2609417 RepID=A0AA97FCJ5_9EURY|nr:universal stress protein [Methanoplanus sp. FWC-SCC4]WOF15724.1 universal stress protein [Methanoplanus sp. FWC-SCC4]